MDLRTGCAFWVLKNGLLASYPSLHTDESADVAVLGAGITGALVAYRLTQAGANVVVLDKRDVASGSTAATTGLLQYETDPSLEQLAVSIGLEAGVRVYRMGLEAVDRIEAMCGDIGDPCGFSRRACLYLASSRRDARALTREHALRRAQGFDVDWLPAAEVKSRWGIASNGGLYGQGDGEIDCFRFTHRLLMKAATQGARVYDRTAVKTVRQHADGVELVTATGLRVHARRLVCATGYETTEQVGGRGRPAYRIRALTNLNSTFACVTEPVASFDGWTDRCLIWETARPYFYLRTTDDGRVMMGGEDSPFSTRHQSERVLQKKGNRLVKRFTQMFPHISIEAAYTWGGVFAETRDGLPFIGAREGEPNVWYALGYGANGITFAAMAADLIRDFYLGRDTPDAALFSFTRLRSRD